MCCWLSYIWERSSKNLTCPISNGTMSQIWAGQKYDLAPISSSSIDMTLSKLPSREKTQPFLANKRTTDVDHVLVSKSPASQPGFLGPPHQKADPRSADTASSKDTGRRTALFIWKVHIGNLVTFTSSTDGCSICSPFYSYECFYLFWSHFIDPVLHYWAPLVDDAIFWLRVDHPLQLCQPWPPFSHG